jgi:hypothetical protein
MAVWTMPAKILLPAWMFEGQIGRLPNGHQVLAYVAALGYSCMRPRCLEGGRSLGGAATTVERRRPCIRR